MEPTKPSATTDDTVQPRRSTRLQKSRTRSQDPSHRHVERRNSTRPTPKATTSYESENPSEFVMSKMLSHGVNDDAEHPTALLGQTVYCVRCYGYGADDDTWEPIQNLPRNAVASYYRRKGQKLPSDISRAQLD